MNGMQDETLINRRPIITCAGELEVFSAIEDNLSHDLLQDSSEWKRSMGRPVRLVRIGANFAPFTSSSLPKGLPWDLVRQPLFHIYWTECPDIDTYKSVLKEDIEIWLKELNLRDIQDWMIIVVENYDGKKATKLLPRTTVLDKVRADFASKQGDRCISVLNPGRPESKCTDSWKGLVSRMRHLLLIAYAKAVSRLEEYVRQQREKRNTPGWDFMKYFYLQEELAQVLEMLGLYDEALVQYDEIDALFSQFVVNGSTCETISWLGDFQRPLEKWHGLKLGPCKLPKNPSILELRAYLFAKQAHMLLLINKVWEMASRCLPFLHTCTREIATLEIQTPTGALNCWLFLVAMEVLQICDSLNRADAVKDYSLHTAPLWAYASQKLRSLGELCGLLPGMTPSSEQLHIVVGLSAGMGDNLGPPNAPSPTDKLKETLCSQEMFKKTYLELAELAMGTYKHTCRIRSARLVGRDVASFYMLLGETQKAAAFLGDALKVFRQDGWNELAAQAEIELADCHRLANDNEKFIRSCAHIATTLEIDTLFRWTYFDEMRKCLGSLHAPLIVPFHDIIKIVNVSLRDTIVIMQDREIIVDVCVESNFPREILCTNAMLSLENDQIKSSEEYCKCGTLTAKDMKEQDPILQRLRVKAHLDYKQDKQLSSASVACPPLDLKRKVSSAPPIQSDFAQCLEVTKLPLVLTPGVNTIRLTRNANKVGKYYLGQLAIHIQNLQLVSRPLLPRLAIQVEEEAPSVRLLKGSGPLIAGIEQTMNLILTIGSYKVDPDWKVRLVASRGLSCQIEGTDEFVPILEIVVGNRNPFTSSKKSLKVLADVLTKEHTISIFCSWLSKPLIVNLSFTPPLDTSWRLYTVKHRKFIQVKVTAQCDADILINKYFLSLGNGYRVIDRSCNKQKVIPNSATFTYMWEFIVNSLKETSNIKAELNMEYQINESGSKNNLYQFFFEISNYQTLYTLEADVEPAKGSEFCRVGILCHLHLRIKSVKSPTELKFPKSVMYEVLADQSVWAVCGRTAGVVSFENGVDPQAVVLDVMPLVSGHLPLPLVRISKYIPAEISLEKPGKNDVHPRLEPFSSGEVFNASKGKQVHVIAAASEGYNS